VIESLKPGDVYQEMLAHFLIVLDVNEKCVLCYESHRTKPLIVSHKGFERHIKYKRFSHNFHTQEHTDKIRSAVYNSLLPFAGNQHKIFKRKSAQLEARITKNK
jgi:hypothetical protein